MRLFFFVLLMLGSGCDRYDPVGETVAPTCSDQTVLLAAPEADSVEGFVDGPVWLDLRCPTESDALTVTRSDGARVDGTASVHHGGRQVRWRADGRLNHQTRYSVHFESTGGVHDWSFTTNAVGGFVADSLSGDAFAMFPTEGELLDPPGVADVLFPALSAGFFPVVQFLDDPDGADGTVPVRLGGRAQESFESKQDVDIPTWSMTARWSDPLFEFGPNRLAWPLADFDFVLEDARFGGGISPDTAWGAGFSMEGWWDTRPADGPLVGEEGALCSLAGDAGGECVECSDGALACLRLELGLARASSWGGDLRDTVP